MPFLAVKTPKIWIMTPTGSTKKQPYAHLEVACWPYLGWEHQIESDRWRQVISSAWRFEIESRDHLIWRLL